MRGGARRACVAAAVALSALVALPASAFAVPNCVPQPQPQPRTIVSGQSRLESVISDKKGQLYFTNEDSLLKLTAPGAQPQVLVSGINGPGGLAFGRDGSLYVGFGDSVETGAIGDVAPQGGLLRVNPDTGSYTVYATGLEMANGVAIDPDGVLYASSDVGDGIDRIVDGQVENNWASVVSGNGLVVDRRADYLYVAQTFQPAAIKRVEIANPANVDTYVEAPPTDIAAGLDGMTRDGRDRLYVAANGGGQVWRVDTNRQICALWTGAPFPSGPSAVAFGHGTDRFLATSLFIVTFAGELIELPNVLP
jgi:sugar lactone lactonase YvrE